MSRVKNVIGPQLRSLRKDREMTQDILVAKLQTNGLSHMNRISVSKIENQTRNVTDYELQIMAKILGVSPNELFPPFSVTLKLVSNIGPR